MSRNAKQKKSASSKKRSRYGFSHFAMTSSILHFMHTSTILPLTASLEGQKLCARRFCCSLKKRCNRQTGYDLPHFGQINSGLFSGNFPFSSISKSLYFKEQKNPRPLGITKLCSKDEDHSRYHLCSPAKRGHFHWLRPA